MELVASFILNPLNRALLPSRGASDRLIIELILLSIKHPFRSE